MMGLTACQHLEAALNHLALAMGAAHEEERTAVAEHPGGTFNTRADDARQWMRVAQATHGKLDRELEGLRRIR